MPHDPSLFDALSAFLPTTQARTWMTPMLVAAYPAEPILSIQWDGQKYQNVAQVNPDKQTWAITGRGVVAELERATRHHDEKLIALLADGVLQASQPEGRAA